MTELCSFRRRTGVTALWALLGLVLVPSARAQTTIGGQIRPRAEARDPAASGSGAFTSMRTRIVLRSELGADVQAFIQVQDVRFWGEETSTLADFSADALDLHQVWVELGTEGEHRLRARVGRQEVTFGGERLVGPVEWAQQGRAFDGVRGMLDLGDLDLDLFGFQLAEEASGTSPADGAFFGAYGVVELGQGRDVDLYLLHDRMDPAGASPDPTLQRTTFGARYDVQAGVWSYRVEASYQTGEELGADVGAHMFGARVGRTFGDGDRGLTLWYDQLSGDEDPGDTKVGVFNTLYATNHKFYGLADLFLDIAADTDGRGLRDGGVKGWRQLNPDVTVRAAVHSFRVVEGEGLSTARLAEEVDLTVEWAYASGVGLTGGLSYVIAHDGMAEIGRSGRNLIWGYLMLSAVF